MTDESLRHRLVSLTCDLVDYPRLTLPEKVREQGLSMVQHPLQSIPGLTCTTHVHQGIPSLVVIPDGHPEPKVLLLAHVDTVEHAHRDHYRATIEGNRLVGPGAGDMKGQLAILLELFVHFHLQHPGVSLGLVVTTDEEVGGSAGVGYLFGAGQVRGGLVVNPDGGGPHQITTEEKGVLHLDLHCEGAAGHAARAWLSENAAHKLMAAVQRVRDAIAPLQTDTDHWHPTCSVTLLNTDNPSINRVPPRATAGLDVRFPRPHTVDSMMTLLREAVGSSGTLTPRMQAEPAHLDPDPAFIACCEAHYGRPAELVRDHGASDSRFIAALGIPVIMSRPEVGNLHSRDEWIDIDSMVDFYRVLKEYLHERLETGGAGPPPSVSP